ncbi:hypothetical protein GCM10010327_07930 [Streptomyces nitrosporeus]|nr:hypothetical protein GCM10010327_07930 [Streptomyces nitrosporeus]
MRAARIGPTVWELDGPMPTEKRSKTEMATGGLLKGWWTPLSAGWCGPGTGGVRAGVVPRAAPGVSRAGRAGARGGGTVPTVQCARCPHRSCEPPGTGPKGLVPAGAYFRPGYSGNFSASAVTRAFRAPAS